MMNATNSNKCVSWSHRIGLAIRQRRISVAIALGGLAILGITLVTSQVKPLSVKKTEELVPVSARLQSTLPKDPHHQAILSTDSQPQASAPTASPDGDLEVIRDFVLDGLEFAVAGAEVFNQFGPFRKIGSTVSWLAQELSQPEDARLMASNAPNDESLAAFPLLSTTEREMATWLVQNSSWTR